MVIEEDPWRLSNHEVAPVPPQPSRRCTSLGEVCKVPFFSPFLPPSPLKSCAPMDEVAVKPLTAHYAITTLPRRNPGKFIPIPFFSQGFNRGNDHGFDQSSLLSLSSSCFYDSSFLKFDGAAELAGFLTDCLRFLFEQAEQFHGFLDF